MNGALTTEKRFYSVVISRELHVHAGSANEAIEMARLAEQYAAAKVTTTVIDPPADEAIPL